MEEPSTKHPFKSCLYISLAISISFIPALLAQKIGGDFAFFIHIDDRGELRIDEEGGGDRVVLGKPHFQPKRKEMEKAFVNRSPVLKTPCYIITH